MMGKVRIMRTTNAEIAYRFKSPFENADILDQQEIRYVFEKAKIKADYGISILGSAHCIFECGKHVFNVNIRLKRDKPYFLGMVVLDENNLRKKEKTIYEGKDRQSLINKMVEMKLKYGTN